MLSLKKMKNKKDLLGILMGVLEHLSGNDMVSQEEGSLFCLFLPIQYACKTASANVIPWGQMLKLTLFHN